MKKVIQVAKRNEIRKSARGVSYFTVEDTEGVTYCCFNANQWADYPEDAGVYSEITEREGKDPTIKLAEDEKKPAKATPQKQFGRDEDKVDIRTALMCASEQMAAWISVGKIKEVDADTPLKLANQTIKVAKILYKDWLVTTKQRVEEIQEEIEA